LASAHQYSTGGHSSQRATGVPPATRSVWIANAINTIACLDLPTGPGTGYAQLRGGAL